MSARQVVFLSSIDWDAAWQRHHAFTAAFARSGWQVFFVENTGFRDPTLADVGRILRRLANFLSPSDPKRAVHPVPEGVRVVSPIVLPPTHGLFQLLNRHWFLPALAKSLRGHGLTEAPTVFAYLPSRTTVDLVDLLAPELCVYDVVDNFRGHPKAPADLAQTEGALLERAGLVLTTSPLLQELHENRHPRVLRIHHGVSEEFFLPPPAPPKKHRRLCYFGTLREGLDYAAIDALAEAGFEVSLIGPAQTPPPKLHPSVRVAGLMPTERLTRELAGFDALLLPYADSEWTQGITPAKIYECLATGRPVIASRMRGLAPLESLLYVADGPSGFVSAARRLDAEETAERVAARVAEAKAHAGPAQFTQILAAMRQR